MPTNERLFDASRDRLPTEQEEDFHRCRSVSFARPVVSVKDTLTASVSPRSFWLRWS